jgi:hypothetical protein
MSVSTRMSAVFGISGRHLPAAFRAAAVDGGEIVPLERNILAAREFRR